MKKKIKMAKIVLYIFLIVGAADMSFPVLLDDSKLFYGYGTDFCNAPDFNSKAICHK